MELILLKSSACLLAFIAFYKVFLERTSSHQFKRFYLLAVVLISIGIPFITFIEYVEPQFITGDFVASNLNPYEPIHLQEKPLNYLPILIWCLYGLGVLLFSVRFIYNLIQIYFKINKNPKQKTASFISVLLQDYVVPHTFFNYIFLNKIKFENKEIPIEVLLHEETHAKQKHTLDILFIELLQIIFWFNPLVYILKRDIRLNHEFLADQAVINQGINTVNYQQLLLEFSSSSSTNQLANAINYSLIKKRFTIMKTKTSIQNLWLRSLLLLPLLAGLTYGFSTTKQVEQDIEKEVVPKTTMTSVNHQTEIPSIKIQETIPTINGIPCDKCQLNLSKEAISNLILGTTTNQEVLSFKIKFRGNPTQTIIGNKGLNKDVESFLTKAPFGSVAQIFDIKTSEKGSFGPILITIVNKDDKNYSHSPKVVKGELSNIPPPPPPPAPKVVKGELSEVPAPPAPPVTAQKQQNPPTQKEIDAYNAWAKKIHSESTIISDKATLFPPVDEQNLIKFSEIYNRMSLQQKNESVEFPFPGLNVKENEHVIKERRNRMIKRESRMVEREHAKKELELKRMEREHVMKDRELKMLEREHARKERELIREEIKNIPPPKPPLDHVIDMAKKSAIFYFDGKKITSDKAIKLLKENGNLNISSNTNDGVSTVKISTKGITLDH